MTKFEEDEKDASVIKAIKPIYVNEDEGGGGGEPKRQAEKAGQGGIVKSGSKMSGAVRVLPAAFAYEDSAHQREKLRARQKEEDRLTDEISEGLDNVTRLASQHLSQLHPQLAKKETLDETDKEDAGADHVEELSAAEKVHTLSYRSSVLENRSNGNEASDEDQTQKQEKETANKERTAELDHDDDGEHTYANLGVTFVELTEKMKSVVSEMSSGNSEEGEDKYSRSSDETAAGKTLDGDGLPYIDEAASAASGEGSSDSNRGSAAALDDAIAAASGLDRRQVVDRVELSSLSEAPSATPVALVTRQRRTGDDDDQTDTRVQSRSRGRVVIVRSDLGEV